MNYLKKIVYFVVENKITFQLLEDCNYYERKDSVSFQYPLSFFDTIKRNEYFTLHCYFIYKKFINRDYAKEEMVIDVK